MHIRILPSFFFTSSTGAPQGDTLGLTNYFCNSSSTWFFTLASYTEDMQYGAIDIGLDLGIRSIVNSSSLSDGNSVMS